MEGAADPGPDPAVPPPPAKPPGRVKVFECPSCGGAVTLRAVGQSITAQCSHCSSLIDVANENYQVIAAANEQSRSAEIPLGTRGKLLGIEWEVVGFQWRRDATGTFTWTEYLLFNPYYGFRFLMEEAGHWTIARMLTQDVPGIGGPTASFAGRTYRRFSEGTAHTAYVGGEFYWRASTEDVSQAIDYVSAPYRLFLERTGEEIIVSHGEYVSAATVAAAFKVRVSSPAAFAAGSNQPNPYSGSLGKVWLTALAGIAAATVLQIGGMAMSAGARVAETSFSFSPVDRDKPVTLATLTLPKDGNVEIDTSSYLNNDWLELDLSLVNVKTGEDFDITQGMERYSGYDSDGEWSEGDPTSSTVFPHVPAGEYKLVATPDAGSLASAPSVSPLSPEITSWLNSGNTGARPTAPAAAAQPAVKGHIVVRRDVMNWSNYGLVLLLLLAYPIYVMLRAGAFEYSRWSNSGSGSDDKEEA